MIIPFGSEKTTVRRLPWVTFAIMGLCVLVFIPTYVLSSNQDEELLAQKYGEVFEYLAAHPYLEVDPRFTEFLQTYWSEEDVAEFKAYLEAAKNFANDPPVSPRKLKEEQEQLQRVVDQLLAAWKEVKSGAFTSFGLVPAHLKAHTLITYQFLHGGWLHLFGNMLFLFVTAPFIEDVWGRLLFPVFYLSAGAISALMFALHYPDSAVPLIGASGAVAGAMGAFLVRFWTTKIKFFVWMIIFWGPFKGPAWVAFPIWFGWEFLQARMWDTISPGSGGGGVAHWAHVWGFAFGLVVAYGIKHYRVEERFIDHAIESKITLIDNTVIDRAMDIHAQGRTDEALDLVRDHLRTDPNNVDAVVAAWTLARSAGRAPEVAPALVRVLRREVRSDDPSLVLSHWQDLLNAVGDLDVEPALLARVAEILADHRLDESTLSTLDLARSKVDPDTAPGVLTRLAKVAKSLEAPIAGAFAAAALATPELPPATRSELEELAEGSPPLPVADGAPATALPPPPNPLLDPPPTPEVAPVLEVVARAEIEHTLQVMEAVPTGLVDNAMILEVGGQSRRMRFDQVQAVGVGGVKRDNQRPYLVVDLLLDPPWSERPRLRVLRLASTGFDPRGLVGGTDSLAAFRRLLELIINGSEAVPLPDPDAARGTPFRTYESLRSYEREVLGISPHDA